ncbi:MAG: hypothetical protein JWO56_616 [Acidobacteria bacterium]|nr:hypothetical protein [Acidobacteriota bacterium]
MKRMLAVVLLLAGSLSASDFDARLAKELDRLTSALQAIDAAAMPKELAPMLDENRKMVERVRNTKDPLVRAYRLRDAYAGVETMRYLAAHRTGANDLAQVRVLSKAIGSAYGKPLAAMRAPALQLALRQNAANRAEKLYRAALPYGKVDAPSSGLYYLGEAEGNRRYRAFVESLPFEGSEEPRPNRAALLAALQKLDTAAIAAFERDPAGRSALGMSSRLKEARELLDRGWLEGAALMLLEAQLDISRKGNAPAVKTGGPAAATHPDSLHAMWQAIAVEDRKGETARFISADVLPLYGSLFRAVALEKKPIRSVTITLVRWPYT